MPEKFQNKYRIPSARAAWWDYGANAHYFITICTKDRKHYFGKVINGEMHLSAIGQIALQCWLEIPQHFPFVILGEFVAMPNHIHGIIIIDKMDNDMHPAVQTQNIASPETHTQNIASPETHTQNLASPHAPKETQDFASLTDITNNDKPKNTFGPQSQNLPSIIRGFKIGVTKSARPINPNFVWQPRYHDHIIRDQKAYENISNYILNNPANWQKDKFHK